MTSGFPDEQDWDDLIHGTTLAYRFLLLQLRHYVEHHDGEGRSVLSLHRRLELSRAEAWERLTGNDFLALATAVELDREEGWQIAAIAPEPPGAIFRLALDPVPGDAGSVDLSLWLSAWGVDPGAVSNVEQQCRQALERLFPAQATAGAEAATRPDHDERSVTPPDVFVGYNMTGPSFDLGAA